MDIDESRQGYYYETINCELFRKIEYSEKRRQSTSIGSPQFIDTVDRNIVSQVLWRNRVNTWKTFDAGHFSLRSGKQEN